MLLKKITGNIKKLHLKIIALAAAMIFCLNVSAHVFEIRYNQASDGSIIWYLISYHSTEQCPAEQAGLTINGTNYPITSYVIGNGSLLSPNIFVQDLGCCARLNPNQTCATGSGLYVSYGIVNTPFIGGALTITPYSSAVCFAFCVGGTIVFNPPPVINCPGNITQNADAGVCNALVTVPGPTVIDNCTYSGANPELVINGSFSAGAASWNHCGNIVEAFCNETCYGGSDGTNRVAEIDHDFGPSTADDRTLCQNISGFISGKIYQLKFKASRRVGAPPTVGAIVKIDGGAFITTVSRSNASFNLTDETFTFFATQTTHQLTFVPTTGWSGSLGFIVDDISIKKQMGSITNNYNNTNNASDTYPVGITNVVWTILDCSGNSHTCNQTVEVIDNQDPVITVTDRLICFETGNNGCNINLGASATDNCGIATFTSDSPSCFPVGTTTVTWTAVDVNGNTATATQIVTRNPEINVNICAGPTNIIYTGTAGGAGPFGPTTVKLTSSASGGTPGYTYSWSPALGLNSTTIASPNASPTVTTIYTLTVTDSKGCTRSLSITIQVLPLSSAVCSTNGNVKFSVCHIPPGNPANAHNICIAPSALNAHLTSGSNGHNNCYLGPCRNLCVSTANAPGNQFANIDNSREQQSSKAVEYAEETKEETFNSLTVNISPNPTYGSFLLKINSDDSKEKIVVRVIDATGKQMESFTNVMIGSSVRFGGSYKGGNYYAEVIQGSSRKMVKLVKLN